MAGDGISGTAEISLQAAKSIPVMVTASTLSLPILARTARGERSGCGPDRIDDSGFTMSRRYVVDRKFFVRFYAKSVHEV